MNFEFILTFFKTDFFVLTYKRVDKVKLAQQVVSAALEQIVVPAGDQS